ncbi:MAG: 50S ribosomal protein L15 [Alphaproteobacteria bacterium]|nr:50S ribosomal protein L15 [Alphaproteobacteria bacterium]
MFSLTTIRDKKAATKSKMRVGRGIGSGKGKTCGRGHKGQKSRSGVSIRWFEGGQSPLFRRLGKRGFNNAFFKNVFATINLSELQKLVDAKKISGKVDYASLRALGAIPSAADGLKILGRGELKASLEISAAEFSASAKTAIEKAGGKVIELKVAKPTGRKVKSTKPASTTTRIEKKKAAKK